MDAGLLGKMDQFSDGFDFHLSHHAASVYLGGFLGRAEVNGDLFIQHPGGDKVEDLAWSKNSCRLSMVIL